MAAAANTGEDVADASAAQTLASHVLLAESPRTPIEIIESAGDATGDAAEDDARSAKLDTPSPRAPLAGGQWSGEGWGGGLRAEDKAARLGPHFDAARFRARLHETQQALRRAAAWENAGPSPDFQENKPQAERPPAHRRLRHIHAPHTKLHGRHKPKRKQKSRRSSPLVWLCVCAGGAATVFGLVVAGFGFLDGRADLWRLGLPVALAGQAAMGIGLLLPLFLRRDPAPPAEHRPHRPRPHRLASSPPWSRTTRRALRRHIDRPA
jgi:hypothetical protein